MQLRNLTLATIVLCTFVTATSNGQATDESINSELNAAEGMSGGKPIVQGDLIPEDQQRLNESRPAGPPPSGKQPETPKVITKKAEPPPPKVESPKIETSPEEVPPPPEAEAEAPAAEVDENIPEPPTLEDKAADSGVKDSGSKDSHVQVVANDKGPCDCRPKVGVPYRDRRSAISGFLGFEGGTYSPVNYAPQINFGQTYSGYYGGGASPNMELVFGLKYNFFLGSLGAQVSGGSFSATAGSGAVLKVNPITAGIIYSMDSIFKEPYVVPYVVAGYYTDFYKEVDQGLSVDGQTSYAPFYSVGLMFQLDWIDPETHYSGYKDFGLENTFLFLEMRSFLASNDITADFSTPLQFSGGFRFEF